MTSALRGEGVKKAQNFVDVIYGCPLREKVFGNSYSLENSLRESIFREDLFSYNRPPADQGEGGGSEGEGGGGEGGRHQEDQPRHRRPGTNCRK